MAFELVYTSVPRGIRSGSSGFCTVAYTNGLAANLIVQLESMSAYKTYFPHYDANAAFNPVAYSHFIYQHSGREHHILSRICFYGQDYTRRSNKLASHIVMSTAEISSVPGGPADVFLLDGVVRSEWQGEPELFEKQLQISAPEQPSRPAERWRDYCGDAGWAGVLAESFLKSPDKPVFIIFDPLKHTDMLGLMREALMLLPTEDRWKVTFNTYFTMMPAGLHCNWRCCVPNSDSLKEARRSPGILVIDLTRPMAEAAESKWVQAARTGIMPEQPKPAANLPPVPPPAFPNSLPTVANPGAPNIIGSSVIADPPKTHTAPRITIPQRNNINPAGMPNQPHYGNTDGRGNYPNYRVDPVYQAFPVLNGKPKNHILLWGLIAALILAVGAAAVMGFLWWESQSAIPKSAGNEKKNKQKAGIRSSGKKTSGSAAKNEKSSKSVSDPNKSREKDKAKNGNSDDQKHGKNNRTDSGNKDTAGNEPASSVPPAIPAQHAPKAAAPAQPAPKAAAPAQSATQPKVSPYEIYYFWQRQEHVGALKGSSKTWRSEKPVVGGLEPGLRVRSATVSYVWNDPAPKTDKKSFTLDESGKLAVKCEITEGLNFNEIVLFEYKVILQENGHLEFTFLKKHKNAKKLEWESLELNDGREIPCKFIPGKALIDPAAAEVIVSFKDGFVSTMLDKLPSILGKAAKPPYKLIFRCKDETIKIALKPGKDGRFEGRAALTSESEAKLNRWKIEFAEKLKKNPLLQKNKEKAKKTKGNGITDNDVENFSKGEFFDQPVEKVEKLLRLFQVETNLLKDFKKQMKNPYGKFGKPDPNFGKIEYDSLRKKMDAPETTAEIYSGKFCIMRIDKSKIKFK